MEKKNIYAAVLKTGQFTKFNDLESLRRVPSDIVECYLRGNYYKTYEGIRNTTTWYQFDFIDPDGNVVPYGIGDFEVVFVGPDDGCSNFFGRKITIRDRRTDTFYTFSSKEYYNLFVKYEIRPLLLQLNECETEDEVRKVLDAPKTYEQLDRENRILREYVDRSSELLDEFRSKL